MTSWLGERVQCSYQRGAAYMGARRILTHTVMCTYLHTFTRTAEGQRAMAAMPANNTWMAPCCEITLINHRLAFGGT